MEEEADPSVGAAVGGGVEGGGGMRVRLCCRVRARDVACWQAVCKVETRQARAEGEEVMRVRSSMAPGDRVEVACGIVCVSVCACIFCACMHELSACYWKHMSQPQNTIMTPSKTYKDMSGKQHISW